MSSQQAASGAAALLSELVGTVDVSSVCIPSDARVIDPALEPVAHELGLSVTQRPTGDEDALCLVFTSQSDETPSRLDSVLEPYPRAPFVLLFGDASAPGDAVARATAKMRPDARWLARVDGPGEDVVLLAPEDRLLEAEVLVGEWRATLRAGDPLESDQQALDALWRAVERDRQSLTTLVERLAADARELDEVRAARERLSGELARVRAAERREADRVRLEALEDRIWVTDQVRRLAESTSWRLGHRLIRTARRLMFRRDRGTNLPAKIIERMEQPR